MSKTKNWNPKWDIQLGGPGVPMMQAVDASRNCVQEPGKVDPTPSVGAVVVKDDEIIAVSYRGEDGPGDHAEFIALEKKLKGVDLTGATIYTTLEPCTKRGLGKTPCVERIIERGISTVYIGSLDPNPEVRGLGQLKLRRAGAETHLFSQPWMGQVEELNKDFFALFPLDALSQRTASEKMDPAEPGRLFGPNGYAIGYDDKGNKVEWLPDDENPEEMLAMILRRSDDSILKHYQELWDKVWWNRHMVYQHDKRREDCTGTGRVGCEPAARIEKKYGRENLGWNDIDWGLLQGRMSALAWVMGSEWEVSMDT
jgi:pyrimidine deaminase RibD-like protein